jgi:hypothetical protein
MQLYLSWQFPLTYRRDLSDFNTLLHRRLNKLNGSSRENIQLVVPADYKTVSPLVAQIFQYTIDSSYTTKALHNPQITVAGVIRLALLSE